MNTTTQRQQLPYWFALEAEAAQHLLDALAQEHKALTEFNAEALECATAAKQSCVEAYESIARRRDQFLAALGLPPGKPGIEALLQRSAATGDEPLSGQWQELQALATQCRRQNLINGGIVELGRRHVERALDLLHGPGPNVNLYGPEGQTAGSQRSQRLAVA